LHPPPTPPLKGGEIKIPSPLAGEDDNGDVKDENDGWNPGNPASMNSLGEMILTPLSE